jgi:hypothetical protein
VVVQDQPAPNLNGGVPPGNQPPPPLVQPPPVVGNDDAGDRILPADQAPADAPLRPMKGMPIYKLSNPQIGNFGPGPGAKLKVHYERMSGDEPGAGPTLVIRTPDGNEHDTFGGFGPFQHQRKADDIVVTFGFKGAPKNIEVYLIHRDRRWEDEGFKPRFKVSNSVVLGNMGRPLQFAREWNAAETAKLNNPPPEAPTMNANNTVGEDTEFIGNMMGPPGGLPAMRWADPR